MNRFMDALFWAHYYGIRGFRAIGLALVAAFYK
jgi:hypothetical protein